MKPVFGAIWRYLKQTDLFLILLTLSASAFGSVLVYSATHGMKRYAISQAGAILIGITCMIILSKLDYHDVTALWKFLGVFGAVFLLTPYIHPYTVKGSADLSWLDLHFTTVQPSEFVKLIFVLTFAKHYDMVKEKIKSFKTVLLLTLHAMVPIGIIVIQKDMGMALVFIMIFGFMMFAGNVQLRYFVAALILALISAPLAWKAVGDTQRYRIMALFDPTNPTYAGTAMQQLYAKYAIGSGEFWGYGLFHGPRTQSQLTSGLLPERQNDMIFAVAGEELGFIGCMAIILLLLVLMIRLVMDARKSKDALGSMICVGIFASFTVQILINLGMVLTLMPVIGIALPFFSSGGSSMLSSYLAIGLVLSVYMHRKTSMFAGQDKG